eukprot:2066674-Rhodomonas_salina.1
MSSGIMADVRASCSQGLATIGEDPGLRERMESGSDVPLVVLDHWGANMVESLKKLAVDRSMLEDGVSVAQSEIDSALEQVCVRPGSAAQAEEA